MGRININDLHKYTDHYERKQKIRKRKQTEEQSDKQPQQTKRKRK